LCFYRGSVVTLKEKEDEGLVKWYPGKNKNIVDQIRRSMENIQDKYTRINGVNNRLNLEYMLFCPDYKVKNLNAAGLDPKRIVDAPDKNILAKRVMQILPANTKLWDDRWNLVNGFFSQQLEVVPDIHAYIEGQEKKFIRMSGGLVHILDSLDMDPFRLRVQATAGSGKSHLAGHFFNKSIDANKRPLLVCFNRPLSERLKCCVKDGGMINTWYGLCDKFLIQMGHKLDYQKAFKEHGYWKEVQDLVIGEDIPDEWLFDSLIVDEGQDFEQEWFDILKLFLRSEDSDIVWLEDQGQNLTRKKPVELEGFVTYHSQVNYRTPQSISKYIHEKLELDFECGNDLPGLGVKEHRLKNTQDKELFLDQVVSDLVKKGFEKDQIAIISFRGIGKSDYLTIKQFGNFKLKKFTGEYDKQGNQLYTDGDITFESIYRFKGQQSPAVILVDIDPNPKDPEWYNKLLYCGMTRATVRLDLIL
jgi:hypothetical protein